MQLQLLEETAQRHRWTVTSFHKLAEAGIFTEDDRIELIDGELVKMAPIGDEHAGQVNWLSNELAYRLHQQVIVATQNPIALGEHSNPQPDITLLRWRDDYYRGKSPTPEDILLIIEIADTSVRYDREVKVPLYAQHHIPEVWLVDLQQRQMDVYRQPENSAYSEISHHQTGQVTSGALPEATINLDDLFL